MVEAASLSPQLRELCSRVAAHPLGLGFLHRAALECVSVTLQVHPRLVVRARELLETEAGRAQIIEEVRLAKTRLDSQGDAGQEPPVPARVEDPPDGPEELIEAAKRHPLGLPFLLQASFETVAITFHVHPGVVFRARELLTRNEASHDSRPRGTEM